MPYSAPPSLPLTSIVALVEEQLEAVSETAALRPPAGGPGSVPLNDEYEAVVDPPLRDQAGSGREASGPGGTVVLTLGSGARASHPMKAPAGAAAGNRLLQSVPQRDSGLRRGSETAQNMSAPKLETPRTAMDFSWRKLSTRITLPPRVHAQQCARWNARILIQPGAPSQRILSARRPRYVSVATATCDPGGWRLGSRLAVGDTSNTAPATWMTPTPHRPDADKGGLQTIVCVVRTKT